MSMENAILHLFEGLLTSTIPVDDREVLPHKIIESRREL